MESMDIPLTPDGISSLELSRQLVAERVVGGTLLLVRPSDLAYFTSGGCARVVVQRYPSEINAQKRIRALAADFHCKLIEVGLERADPPFVAGVAGIEGEAWKPNPNGRLLGTSLESFQIEWQPAALYIMEPANASRLLELYERALHEHDWIVRVVLLTGDSGAMISQPSSSRAAFANVIRDAQDCHLLTYSYQPIVSNVATFATFPLLVNADLLD